MKRGGSKMGYAEQFNLLSPCYKDGEQRASDFRIGGAKATKKGKKATTKKAKSSSKKQRGGSSCGASPSVAEMGVVDRPASLEPTESERAWDNRMRGGANGNSVIVPLNNKKQVSITTNTNNLFSINSKPVENTKNNGSLNKIKNKILPEGTISGLAMKLIKMNKNNTNHTKEKYSFEIIYKKDGNDEIKQLVLPNIGFREFLDEYLRISTDVFPRPPKTNGKNTQAVAKANAVPTAVPTANTLSQLNGGRKHKKNRK